MRKAKVSEWNWDVFIPNPKLKLLDQVREVIRFRHDSIRTEQAYVDCIKHYIFLHGKRHPREMGAAEIRTFLTHLAVGRNAGASTHLLEAECDIRTVQELLEHESVETTQICTHVMRRPGFGVKSPLDAMG